MRGLVDAIGRVHAPVARDDERGWCAVCIDEPEMRQRGWPCFTMRHVIESQLLMAAPEPIETGGVPS